MSENTNKPTQNSSNEIDLIELIRHLWDSRKLIFKITGAFIALGLIIALTSPKQYKVEVRMLPESQSSASGGASSLLKQFGGLAGFAMPLNEGVDAIGPMLYPDVLKSTPFYLELLDHKVTYRTNNETLKITVFEYLNDYTKSSLLEIVSKYTIKLPWTVSGWIRGNNKDKEKENILGHKHFIQITKEQFETIEGLMERINATIDQKNGVISITAELYDPYITAQIADFSVNYLSNYITEYRTEKATEDLLFIKKTYKEKETEYLKAQEKLAQFRDANRNVQWAAAKTEEERLQNTYTLAFNVYNGLAQQFEQARIKVQEETPVIKILEPVQVPAERSKPKRSLILIIFAFLGGFLGIGTIITKLIVSKIRETLQNK